MPVELARHEATTARAGERVIRTSCSCGSWLIAEGAEDGRLVVRWRFNRLCAVTDLAFKRLRAAR